MNEWAVLLIVLFLADAVLAPAAVGTVRTAGQMAFNSVVDLALVGMVLAAVGVL